MTVLERIVANYARKKMLNKVRRNLGSIAEVAEGIAKKWGKVSIPFNTLDIIIKQSSHKDEKGNVYLKQNSDNSHNEFFIIYNKDLVRLKNSLIMLAKKHKSDEISVEAIKKLTVQLYFEWRDSFNKELAA